MVPNLQLLLAGIQSHTFIRPDYFAELDCDDALNQRDLPGTFDSDWSDAFHTSKELWSQVPSEARAQVEEIEKTAFLIVSNATHQHEIASYVADDLNLICRSMLLGLKHPVVEHLWLAYQDGRFPLPSTYSDQTNKT